MLGPYLREYPDREGACLQQLLHEADGDKAGTAAHAAEIVRHDAGPHLEVVDDHGRQRRRPVQSSDEDESRVQCDIGKASSVTTPAFLSRKVTWKGASQTAGHWYCAHVGGKWGVARIEKAAVHHQDTDLQAVNKAWLRAATHHAVAVPLHMNISTLCVHVSALHVHVYG